MSSGLIFDPDLESFKSQRESQPLTVLSGGNNSGKSAVLKGLKQQLGKASYMVGPARFYQVHHIATQQRDPSELENLENQFQSSYVQPEINNEQNFLDLQRVLINLSDRERDKVFEICGNLIGSKISLQHVDSDNRLSMQYIDIDGLTLGLASTGTRLLITLLGICMDSRFTAVLIDEPELGLSPKVQEALSVFLQDPTERSRIFPHLKNVYIATHSHLFLDRKEPKNNFVVSKIGANIRISQTQTISELHWLQFNLLGNSLEKISLPSAVLIVEGPSDYEYLKRVIELKLPDKRVTVSSSSGNVKEKVNSFKEMLGGDLQKSPYSDRLFVVLDSVHTPGTKDSLKRSGVNESQIIIWDQNGIEYMYPVKILANIFSVAESSVVSELKITGDKVSVRTIEYTKSQLCSKVLEQLNGASILPDELNTKLLDPLIASIS